MSGLAAAAPAAPWRRVWALSWPTMLANLTVPLLGAVDTAVMGHLPDAAYVGAVGLGAAIFAFVYWGFGFLRMGTTGFAAQAYGARDADEMRAVLARALLVGAALSLAIIALQWPLRAAVFAILDGAAPVEALAAAYFDVRIWGAPAALANYAVLGWLLGMQMARTALAVQVAINAVNIALDLLFVLSFGWGVAGVAAATVVAQFTGAALGLWLVARRLDALGGAWRRARILDVARLGEMMRVSRDIFIRTLAMILAWSLFTAKGAALGTTVLAANVILMNFQTFLAHGLDGFAHATSALVGEATGARDRRALRQAVVAATAMAGAVALAYTAVYAAAAAPLVNLLTDIAELRAFAGEYLVWVVVSPLVSMWSYQLDGIFIGATRAREMRNGMLIAVACYLAAIAVLPDWWGNHGMWAALMVFMTARAAALGVWYPRLERAAGPHP